MEALTELAKGIAGRASVLELVLIATVGWFLFTKRKDDEKTRQMLNEIHQKHKEELLTVIQKFQEGQSSTRDALTEIRVLLTTFLNSR